MLDDEDVKTYRSPVGKVAYLAVDRVDMKHCARELARDMRSPQIRDGCDGSARPDT